MPDNRILEPLSSGHSSAAADLVAEAIIAERDGSRALATSLLSRAMSLAPDWDEPLIRMAQCRRAEHKMKEARALYRKATSLPRCRVECFISAGVLALQDNEPHEAFDYLSRATDMEPTNHEAWHALAFASMEMELPGLACHAITVAGRLAPHRLPYALMHRDLMAAVGGEFQVAIESPPWTPAVELACEAKIARQAGYLQEAIALAETALELQPNDVDILQLMASLRDANLEPEISEKLLRDAFQQRQNDVDIRNDLAVALGRQYKYGEAMILLENAVISPVKSPMILLNRAIIKASAGEISGSMADVQLASPYAPAELLALTECSLLPYQEGTTAEIMLAAMKRLASSTPEDRPPLTKINNFDPDRILRVGLLSHTLKRHPVGWLTCAGFEQLDREKFKLQCFGHYVEHDPFAVRFDRLAEKWHECAGKNLLEIGELIAENEVDILVDLSGIGDSGLLGALAYRPAPVQVKWVGTQAATTGMRRVDWIITDRWETPDGYERFYTERLLRLPDGYVCYSPPVSPPSVTPLPALGNGFVTFGCFNNLTKITDETLGLWGRILSRVQNARLVLRCPQFSEVMIPPRFRERAALYGIDVERLELRGRAAHHQFISGYQDVDIALDPVPYSGGLTTCESLFMGVPVITLAGEFFAARHSVSHLCNVGLSDCVTNSAEAYVDRAVSIASDLKALAILRAGLRQQVLESPLCDAPRFGRNLGNALRDVWREYCQSHGGA